MSDVTVVPQEGYVPRVAASVIAGDDVEQEEWERLVSSLAKQGIEAIFISWNGEEKTPPEWMQFSEIPTAYVHTPCPPKLPKPGHFSEQRNRSLELAMKWAGGDSSRWVLWIDTDDTLEGDLMAALADIDEASLGVFLRYDYGIDPDTGVVAIAHWRERLFRGDGSWRWLYRIHEVCHAAPGTQLARRDAAWIKHWRLPGDDDATRERNRELIELASEETPHPRFVMYGANELHAQAVNEEEDMEQRKKLLIASRDLYRRFLDTDGSSDDAYLANHRMADIERELGRHAESIDTDLQGIKMRPSWPDSYNGIAVACMHMSDWDKCEQWATLCIDSASAPLTTQVIETLESSYSPRLIRGQARVAKGNLKGAMEDLKLAAAIWEPEVLTSQIEQLDRQIKLAEQQDATVKLDVTALRKSLKSSRPEKSVALFTRPLFESWSPQHEAWGGFGGAEQCIIRLAPRLAELGWRVAVFGTPGEYEGVHDGVEWWQSDDWSATEKFSVVVSSRAPEIFDSNFEGGRVLWVHDVNCGEELNAGSGLHGDRQNRIDVVLALTEWHKQHLEGLYGLRNVSVMPNGVELGYFGRIPEVRKAPKFVYASSPDRGLDVLLGMWEQIREVWPDATLDVFYGWVAIDKIITMMGDSARASRLAGFKRYIVSSIEHLGGEEGGIFWRDRVSQKKLARELYKYSVWTYPTFFMETFCITALEMQLAGVIPVTSNLAALGETVYDKDQMITGWPNNQNYRDRWLLLLEETMGKLQARPDLVQGNALAARDHAKQYAWDTIAQRWDRLLTDVAK